MSKINLATGKPLLSFDELDKLLSSEVSGIASPPASPPAKERGDKFDRYNQEFPEETKIHFRQGTKAVLQSKYKELGFSSVSTMIRSAISFALQSENFKKGWNDRNVIF